MHKFLFDLLNVSHTALSGLTHVWFASSDAEEWYYSFFIIKWRSCLMGITT